MKWTIPLVLVILAGCATAGQDITFRRAEGVQVPDQARLALPKVVYRGRTLGTLEGRLDGTRLLVQCEQIAEIVQLERNEVCQDPTQYVDVEDLPWATFIWNKSRQKITIRDANRLSLPRPGGSGGGVKTFAPRKGPQPETVEADQPTMTRPGFEVSSRADLFGRTSNRVTASSTVLGGLGQASISTRNREPDSGSVSYRRRPHSARVNIRDRGLEARYRFSKPTWSLEAEHDPVRGLDLEGDYRWGFGQAEVGWNQEHGPRAGVDLWTNVAGVHLRASHDEGRSRRTSISAFRSFGPVQADARVTRRQFGERVQYQGDLRTTYRPSLDWEVENRLRWPSLNNRTSVEYKRLRGSVSWDPGGVRSVSSSYQYRGDDYSASLSASHRFGGGTSIFGSASYLQDWGVLSASAGYGTDRDLTASVSVTFGLQPATGGYRLQRNPDSHAVAQVEVWIDEDDDGERDPGEKPLRGVRFNGYDARTGPSGRAVLNLQAGTPVTVELNPDSLDDPYLFPPKPRQIEAPPLSLQRIAFPVTEKTLEDMKL